MPRMPRETKLAEVEQMTPYFETKNGVLYHGNCLSILPHLEPVDLVLTDPPWNLGYFENDNKEWCEYYKWLEMFINKIKPISKVIWIFQSTKAIPYISPLFKGWMVFASLKNFCQMHPKKIPNAFDIAFFNSCYGYKGNGRNWHIGNNANIKMSRSSHPTNRPLDTVQYILEMYSLKDILDPFLGSGTTAVACERLNRKWIGIEIEEKYCEIAAKRNEGESRQRKLF